MGLNQVDLARLVGVRQSAISNIEVGKRNGLQSLQPIAKALGVRYEWLRTGEEPMLDDAPAPVFSNDLLQRIQAMSPAEMRRLENQLRAAVDMNPLPRLEPAAGLGESRPVTGTHDA